MREVVSGSAGLILLFAGILTCTDAHAGAPASYAEMRIVTYKVPRGGPIVLEFSGNCMAKLPDSLNGKVRIERDGNPVPGSWRKDARSGFQPQRGARRPPGR
ncbi:MAG: hypothetical protein HY897_03245 [Deltaproteobacteria bacterium]|nr:hypothetical protein [Deltaproteobacteria bacterium]